MEEETSFWWLNLPSKFILKFKNKDYSSSGLVKFFDGLNHEDKIIIYVNDPLLEHVGVYEYLTNYKRLTYIEEVESLSFKNIEWIKRYIDINLSSNLVGDEFKEITKSQFDEIRSLLKIEVPVASETSKEIIEEAAIDSDGTPLVDADGAKLTINTEIKDGENDTEPFDLNMPIYTVTTDVQYSSYSIKDTSISPVFKVEQIAHVYAEHIVEFKKDNGQMLCITGKWGRGKTYFINKLCDKLNIDCDKETSDDESKFHFVKFHAWKYQDTPAIWAYLYKILISSYANEFNEFNKWKLWQISKSRYWQIFKLTISSKGHWNTWVKSAVLIGFAFLWYFIFSFQDKLNTFKSISLWFGGTAALLLFIFKVLSFRANTKKPLKNLFQSFSKIPSFNQLLGFQAEIQTELIHLLKAWINKPEEKRLLLFIDDLDRCSEDRMVQIVDALRVMLENPEITSRMIILVAVDEEKLKKAIRYKYKDLYEEDDDELDKLENEYMDKLFISGIKLAPLTKENRVEFFETILKDENHPSLNENSGSVTTSNTQESSESSEESSSSNSSEESGRDGRQSNTTTPPEEENIELSEHEIEFFKIELEKKEELNPRQIRILYYRYRLARNLWAKLHPSEQFPSEAIVKNLFLDEPEISEAQGKDILEMVRAY